MRDIKQDFLIEITSVQESGDDSDEIKVKTRGKVSEVNGKIYVAYSDYENNEECRCVIKVEDEKQVNVIKNGRVCSRLVLEKGKKHYCPYTFKEGTLMLGIFTDYIDIDYNEDKCNIEFKYILEMNSKFIGRNKISIKANRIRN